MAVKVVGARDKAVGESPEDAGQPWRRRLQWLLLAGLVLVSGVLLASGAPRYLSPRVLVENYAGFKDFLAAHWWEGLAIYAAGYATMVALSIPGGLVLTIAGGLFFGWLVGGVVTVLAATLGATLLFVLARTTLGQTLARQAGPRISAMREGFRDDAVSYLLFLRLVPVFPFWLVNLAPALLGVGLGTFVATTLVGIAPGTFAFTVIGAGLDSVVALQAEQLAECRAAGGGDCAVSLSFSNLLTPTLFAAFVALGALALLPALAKRLWRVRGHGRGGAPG